MLTPLTRAKVEKEYCLNFNSPHIMLLTSHWSVLQQKAKKFPDAPKSLDFDSK